MNDNMWICSACGRPKQLAGSHLAGKSAVNSDCWPCGRKRVFHLRKTLAATTNGASTVAVDGNHTRQSGLAMGERAATDETGANTIGSAAPQQSQTTQQQYGAPPSPATAPAAGSSQQAHQPGFPSWDQISANEAAEAAAAAASGARSVSPQQHPAAAEAAARFAAWASAKVGGTRGPPSSAPPPLPHPQQQEASPVAGERVAIGVAPGSGAAAAPIGRSPTTLTAATHANSNGGSSISNNKGVLPSSSFASPLGGAAMAAVVGKSRGGAFGHQDDGTATGSNRRGPVNSSSPPRRLPTETQQQQPEQQHQQQPQAASNDEDRRQRSASGIFFATQHQQQPRSAATTAAGAAGPFRLPSPAPGSDGRHHGRTASTHSDGALLGGGRCHSGNSSSAARLAAADTTGASYPPRTVIGSLLLHGNSGGDAAGVVPPMVVTKRPIDGMWRCEKCNKVKNLSGPHLDGKTSVRSDCWPCGRKRTFYLRFVSQPSAAELQLRASLVAPVARATLLPPGDDRRDGPMPHTVSSLEEFTLSESPHHLPPTSLLQQQQQSALPSAARTTLDPGPVNFAAASSIWASASSAIDLKQFLTRIFIHQHSHDAARNDGTNNSSHVVLRPCPPPPNAEHLPHLFLIEQSQASAPALGWACPVIGDESSSTTATATGNGGANHQLLQQHQGGSGRPQPSEAREAAVERLACLAARLGPAITSAVSRLGVQPRPRTANENEQGTTRSDSGEFVVAVFCSAHDELAALAAYLALARSPLPIRLHGPPPEYTTSRTVATELLAAVRAAFDGFPAAVVTAPVPHDDRHRAVKYIAKRADGLLVSPGGAVGFAIADRAHLVWAQQQQPCIPAHSIVLLGRPAKWHEIERVLRVVEALKLADQPPNSPCHNTSGCGEEQF